MNASYTTIGMLLGLCTAVVVASVVFPRSMNPLEHLMGEKDITGTHDMIPTNNERKVPLYVYVGTPVTARRWSTFSDRRHADARSPLLDMLATTHRAHHTIGPIVPIDDEYLMGVLHKIATKDTIRAIEGDRGAVSLQHDRILRDALLCHVVCKGGGILIPSNVLVTRPTGILWESVMKTPKDTMLVYYEDGNSELGCPIIATRANTSTCEIVTTTMFGAGIQREFNGGIGFSGGSSVIFDRLKAAGVPIQTMTGVSSVNTDTLTEMKPVPDILRSSVCVMIPFEQGSGKTSIPRRDQWIYSDSQEGILKNPTVLRELFLLSHRHALGK